MKQSQQTTGAVRAAKSIIQLMTLNRNDLLRFLDDADVPNGLTDTFSTIIDQETAADRDRLKEEIKGLKKRIKELRDAAVTHYRKLYGHPDCLKEENVKTRAALAKAEPK